MDWQLSLTITIISVISVIFLFFKHRFSYWKNRGVPYLEPEIPYGNIKNVGNTIHQTVLFNKIYEKFKGKALFAGAYFSINPVAIITDLDLVKTILIKDFNYFHDRAQYYNEEVDPISAHLFALDGEKWKILRSKLSPTFTSGKMKFMYSTIKDVSDRFIESLTELAKKDKVLEMRDISGRFTTDVIGSCAFGLECNSLNDPNNEFRTITIDIFDNPPISRLLTEIVNHCPSIGRFFGVKLFSDEANSFFKKIVQSTIDYREKNNVRRNDFMDMMIQLKNGKLEGESDKLGKLTFNEVLAQAFVFFIAGFETSATTMTFALYELVKNPEVQEKLRDEILLTLEKFNGELSYEAVLSMKYLDQVINETLRKYPPVILLVRKAAKDYHVPNTDKVIEKGTGVIIPSYAIQRDPEVYPNPDKFDPDRFTPEEVQKRHPMAFLGFGDGPRNCIGLRFGRLQARVGLAQLLKNFRFKKSPNTLDSMVYANQSLLLAPKGGMPLIVEKI